MNRYRPLHDIELNEFFSSMSIGELLFDLDLLPVTQISFCMTKGDNQFYRGECYCFLWWTRLGSVDRPL
jgi:hypothetical protein